MRQKRNVLEAQIDALKSRRSEIGEEVYYRELENLAVQIADLYKALEEPADAEENEAESEVTN